MRFERWTSFRQKTLFNALLNTEYIMPNRAPRELRVPSPPHLARGSLILKTRPQLTYEPLRPIAMPIDTRPPPLYYVRHLAAPPPENAGPVEAES